MRVAVMTAGFTKRPTQVNVRLTHEEKSMIGVAAKSGFKGLADFVRTTFLDYALFGR